MMNHMGAAGLAAVGIAGVISFSSSPARAEPGPSYYCMIQAQEDCQDAEDYKTCYDQDFEACFSAPIKGQCDPEDPGCIPGKGGYGELEPRIVTHVTLSSLGYAALRLEPS